MRMRLLFLVIAGLAAVAFLAAACGDDDDDDSGGSPTAAATGSPTAAATGSGGAGEPLNVTIAAENFAFDKTTIEAEDGQTVNITFVNDDAARHSFTVGSTDVVDAAGGSGGNGSFTATASTTEFHCKYHPQMTGTISVDGQTSNTGGGGGGVSFGY